MYKFYFISNQKQKEMATKTVATRISDEEYNELKSLSEQQEKPLSEIVHNRLFSVVNNPVNSEAEELRESLTLENEQLKSEVNRLNAERNREETELNAVNEQLKADNERITLQFNELNTRFQSVINTVNSKETEIETLRNTLNTAAPYILPVNEFERLLLQHVCALESQRTNKNITPALLCLSMAKNYLVKGIYPGFSPVSNRTVWRIMETAKNKNQQPENIPDNNE